LTTEDTEDTEREEATMTKLRFAIVDYGIHGRHGKGGSKDDKAEVRNN
jgi:hypothetical protein